MAVRIIGKVDERDVNAWNILKGYMNDEYFNDGKCRTDGWSMDASNSGWMFLIQIQQDGRVTIQDTTRNTEYSKDHYKRVTNLGDPDMGEIINEEVAKFRSTHYVTNVFGSDLKCWVKKVVAAESKSHGHS